MSKAKDAIIEKARKRFEQAETHWSDERRKMIQDLEFSNPADPQQWDDKIKMQRENSVNGARPCLVFDQTNQYIAQVVNDARENKPSIKVRPEDDKADIKVAQALQGIIRHIEDQSRAGIAYDTAIEYAGRCGLGFIRVITKVVDGPMNKQEMEIQRVHDPVNVLTDPYWTEPDGKDMTYCFIPKKIPKADFEKMYPGKSTQSWFGDDRWYDDDTVMVCEYFEIVESKENMILVRDPMTDDMMEYSESDYWSVSQNAGVTLPYDGKYTAVHKKCMWRKITGNEVLEETEWPGSSIPLVPVIGNETWVDGRRSLSGMVRRMKDSQRAYNYERSAYVEMVSLQPKSPYIAPMEAIEGHEAHWEVANTSNQAILPYNHLDANGNPLPAPTRQAPPQVGSTFIQGSQQAIADMQASIGMYSANLGAKSNETSGKAINARKQEGDMANFHYIDNLARSLAQIGRIIIEAIPKIYDTKRVQRILGEDSKHSLVTMDPEAPQAAQKQQNGSLLINPNIGRYDVTVTVGPAYASRRQEAVEMITALSQGNPQLAAALAPLVMKLSDMPEGDKYAKIAIALLPPPVQAAYNDEDADIPAEIKGQLQAKDKQIKDAEGVMQQMKQEIESMNAQLESKEAETRLKEHELTLKVQQFKHTAAKDVAAAETARYQAETARFAAESKFINPDILKPLILQTLHDMMDAPASQSPINEVNEQLPSVDQTVIDPIQQQGEGMQVPSQYHEQQE